MASTPDTLSSLLEDDNAFQYGLSDRSLLANQKRAKVFDLLNRLHNTGVSADIDLPSIAVIGSQSVGKSSLIEAMSGIALPRESGTCTRCPTECRLSFSEEPWQAKVSIRLSVDKYGSPLDKTTLPQFGEIITSKIEIEERIKRAQLAILNPTTPINDFLTVDLPFPHNESRFSKNSIILEISGPTVNDLAFVDLPGVIVSGSADGDDGDIENVESLVSSHIEKPNCLILLVVTCETDPENQKGRHLARKYDQNGERTIPVLTKPDRIETGDEGAWVAMMRNQKETFNHGWYCVKQPGTAELQDHITWEQARQNELEFFQRRAPWKDVEFNLRERLGTEKLSAALGKKLFDLIVKRLPKVSEELHEQLEDTIEELDNLPPDISDDPVAELLTLVQTFNRRIESVIDGSVVGELGVIQSAADAYERFTKDIGNKTPRFRPFKKSFTSWQTAELREFPEFPAALELDQLDTTSLSADIWYLDDVLQRAKKAVARELPGNYPYSIKPEIIKEYLKPWGRPSRTLVQEIEASLRQELKQVVETEFGEHVHGGLQITVWSIVEECIRSLSEVTKRRVDEACTMEQRAPMTHRSSHFLNYKTHYLEHYRVHYQSSRRGEGFFVKLANGTLQDPQAQLVTTSLGNLIEAGAERINKMDLLKLAPHSDNDSALEIMAEVRAYYHIAMQRYIDRIPMLVDHLLVFKLKEAIPWALNTKLPFGKPDQRALCADLLRQADEVVAKRKELKARKERLEDAREELNRVLVP